MFDQSLRLRMISTGSPNGPDGRMSKYLSTIVVPQSRWEFYGVPLVRIIFSKRTLATEEAVTFYMEMLQFNVKTCKPLLEHILSMQQGQLYEIHLPDLKWLYDKSKCPGAMWTGFSGLNLV